MSPLRLSLVGLGMAVDPHARSLAELSGKVEVVWAASRSEGRTAAFGKSYPFPVTNDIERAITDPEVEAVLLLTPPGSHLELGSMALESGKHLLVEKPLELDAARASELVAAAEQAGRHLGVVLQHRFRAASLRAQELLAAGAIGRIQAATAEVPWWRPQSYYDEPGRGTLARDGGGVLMTQAIHTLDLFRSLVGVEKVVAAQAVTTALHDMETEDYVAALLTLGSGGPGQFMATTAAYPGRAEEIRIIGEGGTLAISGERLALQPLSGEPEIHDETAETGSGASPMAFSHQAHRALIEEFLDAVRDNRPPQSSGKEALATQRLIEEILRCAQSGAAQEMSKP